MSEPLENVLSSGRRRGEGPQATLRHFLLEGILRRLARLPGESGFVLRGGLLTRAWVTPLPRPTRDLDFVGDFPFSVEETAQRFTPLLRDASEDGVVLDPDRYRVEGIWLHSDFPGVRITLLAGLGFAEQEVTLDIGFGDPLVPPAVEFAYPTLGGELITVRAVRPETQLAWKLHGLAEMGTDWRPKDLADLWRIVQRVPLEADVLPAAIEAAFTSRGFSCQDAVTVLRREHWSTKTARVRWGRPHGLPDLERTLAEVRQRLDSVFTSLERTSR